MNQQNIIAQEIIEKSIHLKYLNFEMIDGIHVVSLIDLANYPICKGYGGTIIKAINDLHSALI